MHAFVKSNKNNNVYNTLETTHGTRMRMNSTYYYISFSVSKYCTRI